LAVGKIKLTWVKNGPTKFKKEYSILEKEYTRGGFNEQVENW
jgi:hypothetical protein